MQEVQSKIVRQRFADADAAHAVAAFVERGRKHADAELARQHRDDAAADAAFGRHADAIDPFPREVVHAARRHHAQDRVDELGAHRTLAADRIDAAVGERRRDHRQVAAVDQDRTLFEVQLERGLGIFADDSIVAQHVADRAVAMAGFAFGFEHRLVDRERSARVSRNRADDARQPRFTRVAGNERRRRDGACVDHRIERPAGTGFETDRVERIAARLDTHRVANPFAAAVLERNAVHQRLRDRLDRERLPRRRRPRRRDRRPSRSRCRTTPGSRSRVPVCRSRPSPCRFPTTARAAA